MSSTRGSQPLAHGAASDFTSPTPPRPPQSSAHTLTAHDQGPTRQTRSRTRPPGSGPPRFRTATGVLLPAPTAATAGRRGALTRGGRGRLRGGFAVTTVVFDHWSQGLRNSGRPVAPA